MLDLDHEGYRQSCQHQEGVKWRQQQGIAARVMETICSDSHQRQEQALALAHQVDRCLVVDDGGGATVSLFELLSAIHDKVYCLRWHEDGSWKASIDLTRLTGPGSVALVGGILMPIETAVADVSESDKPRVVYFRTLRQSMMSASRDNYQDFWIRLAGGTNVAAFAGMNTAVNLLQIVAWNPQVMFIGTFDEATPDDLMRNPALARVDAIRQRRVDKLPHGRYRWDPGSHESHLTWQWAAMLLHPERVRFDLR